MIEVKNPSHADRQRCLKPELEAAKAEIKDLAVDEDDLILYTLFPVTGKKFLQRKYGKEAVPESMKPITLDDVKREAELIKKAKAGDLVDKKKFQDMPEKTECLRTFNVFVDDECFEVGVDEIGGAPVIAYAQPAPAPAPGGTCPACCTTGNKGSATACC